MSCKGSFHIVLLLYRRFNPESIFRGRFYREPLFERSGLGGWNGLDDAEDTFGVGAIGFIPFAVG